MKALTLLHPTEISDKKAALRAKRLANLTPWKKGQSGNPGGRTPKPISDKMLQRLIAHKGKVAGAIVQAAIEKAMEGDIPAFIAIRDTVEGKPVQKVEGDHQITITVERIGD